MRHKAVCIFVFCILLYNVVAGQMVFFSGNDDNSIFICDDGRVFMSGENNTGQLGNGTVVPTFYPTEIAGVNGSGASPRCKQVQIEGVATYLALTNSGDTVLSWGFNEFGQLGDGTTIGKKYPVRVKGVGGNGYLHNIKQIATGNYSGYAITGDGKVVSWGNNSFGQVGQGGVGPPVPYPSYVLKGPGDTLKNIKAISAGGVFALALSCDGNVWAWGRNDWGNLGQGNTTVSGYAVRVKKSSGSGYLSNIVKIEAGDNYGFALSATDTLWCWGANWTGNLGTGGTGNWLLPGYVLNPSGKGSLTGITSVAAGQGHTLVLLSDKTVLSFGLNGSGQLGTNDTIGTTLPVKVKAPGGTGILSDVNYIGTGDHFSIARTSDNRLYTWGDNSLGQLGVGDHVNRWLPVNVSLPCSPTSDVIPGFGRMAYASHVCTGSNSGSIYLLRAHESIISWQQSTDNFSSYAAINSTYYSVPYSNLTKTTSYRAVLQECGVNYYSPAATLSMDSLTRPGSIHSSATVRINRNGDTLFLKGYQGAVLGWEFSSDNFVSDIHPVANTSDRFVYKDVSRNTYYRALVQSGACAAAYSDTALIQVADETAVRIYNGFTPDGDNYNDEWVIDYIELFPDNRVEIYNRWGQMVYKASHYDNRRNVWKGESNVTDGKLLADGTYYYLVDLGEGYPLLKGFVVIGR